MTRPRSRGERFRDFHTATSGATTTCLILTLSQRRSRTSTPIILRARRRHRRHQPRSLRPRSRRRRLRPLRHRLRDEPGRCQAGRAPCRRARDGRGRQTALRRPALLARPTAPHRSRLTYPTPGFRAVTFDDLRKAYGRTDQRTFGRRRRFAAGREPSSTRLNAKAAL